MQELESLREIENLRFRFQMNNRLRLESLAELSKLFREFGEPISDDLLSSVVFALPRELVSNGHSYVNHVGSPPMKANADAPPESQPGQHLPPESPKPGPGLPPESPKPGPGLPPESPKPGPGLPPESPKPGPGLPPESPKPGPGLPPESPKPGPGLPPESPKPGPGLPPEPPKPGYSA